MDTGHLNFKSISFEFSIEYSSPGEVQSNIILAIIMFIRRYDERDERASTFSGSAGNTVCTAGVCLVWSPPARPQATME